MEIKLYKTKGDERVINKTLTDELAFALDAKNVPYCFYDLDGQGGTLHEPVEMDNADISIIDTPGSLQGEMGEWVKDADVVKTEANDER